MSRHTKRGADRICRSLDYQQWGISNSVLGRLYGDSMTVTGFRRASICGWSTCLNTFKHVLRVFELPMMSELAVVILRYHIEPHVLELNPHPIR